MTAAPTTKPPGRHATRMLARLVRAEVFPSLLLVAATAGALALANSPWAAAFDELWETPLRLQLGDYAFAKPLHHWINDGLMELFFFFVGLEIKHEILDGQLRSLRQAALPDRKSVV